MYQHEVKIEARRLFPPANQERDGRLGHNRAPNLLISVSLMFSKFATLAITCADSIASADNLSCANPALSRISLNLMAALKHCR